jgi:hypothetical protein
LIFDDFVSFLSEIGKVRKEGSGREGRGREYNRKENILVQFLLDLVVFVSLKKSSLKVPKFVDGERDGVGRREGRKKEKERGERGEGDEFVFSSEKSV